MVFDIQRAGPSTGMPTRTQQGDVLACAYASHGDTKHVLLFPANPKECFAMAVAAFDLAECLQTPVLVLSDLEIGMNDWVTEPFRWDDAKTYDRSKVLDRDSLDALKDFGRYLDVDGDGIAYRTYPGTHPDKGAFFTRGSSHDAYAHHTEKSTAYQETMQRLLRKFASAAQRVPEPLSQGSGSRFGVIYYGSTDAAMGEVLDMLRARGIELDALRVRAFPFSAAKEQRVPLLKAGLQQRGFAFNNHPGSKKSYPYVREHDIAVVPADYDPHDRAAALYYLQRQQASGTVLTGLLYQEPAAMDLHALLDTVERPLNSLTERELCPGQAALEDINHSLR